MLAGIILAAGASSRMGSVKALLPSGDGRSFLARLAETLAAGGVEPLVVVVGRHSAEIASAVRRESLRLRVVLNEKPERGQLSSLVAGLDALAASAPAAAVVVPVDQPLVSPGTVRRLVERWRESRAPVVRPAQGGRHGHPVIFDARLFDELRAADREAGARAVIARHIAEVVDVPVADRGAFEDVDTPDDYARLIGSRLGRLR